MKRMQLLPLAIALIALTACNTNLENIMSADDVASLKAMEAAYLSAVESNNSLANYVESTGITKDQTCFDFDKVYHHYDSIFETNHMMYSHNNNGDDHSIGSWSMGSGWMGGTGGMKGHHGNMTSNSFTSSFCTSYNLDLMDSLMLAHENYHPLN